MRDETDLSGIWRYQPDVCADGERLGYFATECDVRFWREARVPGRLDNVVSGMEAYEGPAWFRRNFYVPAEWRGRWVALRFEGVNYTATVWVNGQLVGRHEDGFLPFEFRIDPLLRVGHPNVLVVCADNTRRAGDVPGLERGWRPFGGILREVTLVSKPLLHIDDLQVTMAGSDGQFALAIHVANDTTAESCIECQVTVIDESGAACAALALLALTIAAGEAASFESTGAIESPKLWSPLTPALYTARVTLLEQGRQIDRCQRRFGFRSIQTRGDKLLLNDQPQRLVGFNRHEDSPRTDMCPDLTTVRADLLDMKRLGANFVRLCHYPHHPAELDLCNEIGLLAMAEIPLYWWGGNKAGTKNSGRTLATAKRQLKSLIQRDRSHPSIIFWSVSNETGEEEPEVASGNAELCDLARQLDPSRLAVHVSNRWQKHPHFEADDVLCVNAYPGVWDSRNPQHDPARSADLWREDLAELHRLYPDRPILVTEFGHPGFEGVFGTSNGEDAQARALEAEFAALSLPYVSGAVIWCYAHHPWPEANFLCNVTTSPFGIVSRERRRLTSWPVVQRMFHEYLGKPLPQARHEGGGGTPPRDRPVRMIRPHMANIPQHPLPEGYAIRTMRKTDGALWTDVQRDSEPVFKIEDDLFWKEFGADPPAIEWRCFLIYDPRGLAVGTISAWYSRDFRGQDWGRIHWVATRPSQRGKGLARAGLTHAMNTLAQWHDRTWLLTSTTRLPAIRIYLDFGFVPDIQESGDDDAWRQIAAAMDHPALANWRR